MAHSKKRIRMILFFGLLLLLLSGCSLIDEEQPLITMKFLVHFDMEAEMLVDEINQDGILYRFYDYQHKKSPNTEQEFMPYAELFQVKGEGDQALPVYSLHMYLDFETKEIEMEVPESFDRAFRSDQAFRDQVAEHLGKPLNDDFRKLLEQE